MGHASVSIGRVLTGMGFAFWVAVCSATPEFIWQGLLYLVGHFTLETAATIVLIGLILAVFVEPIMERLRNGSWELEHQETRGLLYTAPIAFVFGVVAVSLHECMTAYLGAVHAGAGAPPPGLAGALNLILEWALIPLAITLAWFSARLGGRVPWVVEAIACAWMIAVGWFYRWSIHEVISTYIPCIGLLVAGQWYVARHWDHATFQELALGLGLFVLIWFAVCLTGQGVLWLAGVTSWHIYTLAELAEDFRFYLGWALGLALAPNPVHRPAAAHS